MSELIIVGARLAQESSDVLWDVGIKDGIVSHITHHVAPQSRDDNGSADESATETIDAQGGLLLPAMCHAHVHLDKCFLLDDPAYVDLTVEKGDFGEAMELGSQAKSRFTETDLLRRGSRLVEESIANGVTAMRAFAEVDEIVELKCVDAAVKLKAKYENACEIQICAFAQLALFSGSSDSTLALRQRLLRRAAQLVEVEVVGSTPYVEEEGAHENNIEMVVELANQCDKHLDFHLDYFLDSDRRPHIWHVLDKFDTLRSGKQVESNKVITMGHGTALTNFDTHTWNQLTQRVQHLPAHFVGLPMSDLFIMGRPTAYDNEPGREVCDRPRGTLQVLQMIKNFNLSACMAINNVGNGFTPYSNSSLLRLASFGTVVYQAATKQDTDLLYECISTRARQAIGLPSPSLRLREHDTADLVVLCHTPAQQRSELPPSVSGIVRSGDASIQAVIKAGKRVS